LSSLDSLGSLDSSYSLPRFIVSYIIVFEFRIPEEFGIRRIRTGLRIKEEKLEISFSYLAHTIYNIQKNENVIGVLFRLVAKMIYYVVI
jgi:hypothetical protein